MPVVSTIEQFLISTWVAKMSSVEQKKWRMGEGGRNKDFTSKWESSSVGIQADAAGV